MENIIKILEHNNNTLELLFSQAQLESAKELCMNQMILNNQLIKELKKIK